MNYLASPPLVVAYAIAGRIDIDPYNEPLAQDAAGQDVYLKDIWPTQAEINRAIAENVTVEEFCTAYADVFAGDERWRSLAAPAGQTYDWPESTYIRNPPYFEGMTMEVGEAEDIRGARCLAVLGDSITTDHISPAGSIKPDSPAGKYLIGQRRGAEGLQQPGLPPRQPRGDDARHLRQHPAAQPHGPRHRGRRDPAPAQRRAPVHLRRGHALPGRRGPGHRPGRQGVRLRLVPGLGGQGPAPARGAGGDRRELRAHPPLQPGGHGHTAAGVHRRRERPVTGPQRAPRPSTSSGSNNGEAKQVEVRATAPDGRSRPSPPRSGSTPPTRWTTTETAASCTTCCAGWPPDPREANRGGEGTPPPSPELWPLAPARRPPQAGLGQAAAAWSSLANHRIEMLGLPLDAVQDQGEHLVGVRHEGIVVGDLELPLALVAPVLEIGGEDPLDLHGPGEEAVAPGSSCPGPGS